MKEIFTKIWEENLWRNGESASGSGSTLEETEAVRKLLPSLLREFEIRSLLDIPCGDLNWITETELPMGLNYVGADIVPELIESNRRYPLSTLDLRVLDITSDPLPPVDMMLVRDCLGHFSNKDVQSAVANIKRARPKYLLATTFPNEENSGDIETGYWRPLNLASMWGMPDPDSFFPEIDVQFPDGHISTKGLGLWRIQ